jgi:hypothetical protein
MRQPLGLIKNSEMRTAKLTALALSWIILPLLLLPIIMALANTKPVEAG